MGIMFKDNVSVFISYFIQISMQILKIKHKLLIKSIEKNN